MRTFVKYDKQGNIVATCRLQALPEGIKQPYDDLAAGEAVIEIAPSEATAEIPCAEIHSNYRVDVGAKKLVPQQQAGSQAASQPTAKKKSQK